MFSHSESPEKIPSDLELRGAGDGVGEQRIKESIKVRPPSESNARALVKVLVAYVLGRGGRRMGGGVGVGEGEANSHSC